MNPLYPLVRRSKRKTLLHHTLLAVDVGYWVQRALRIDPYTRWRRDHPDGKYSDYYMDVLRDKFDDQPKLVGQNITDRQTTERGGQRALDFLVAQGMQPSHACLEWGCGSLRVGRKLLAYLEPGHYCGMDLTDELYQMGLAYLPPESDKPHTFYTITPEHMAQARQREWDYIISTIVLIHVPLHELDEFLGNVVSLMGARTEAYIEYHRAAFYLPFAHKSFAYPYRLLAERVRRLGATPENIAWRGVHSKFRMLKITRDG